MQAIQVIRNVIQSAQASRLKGGKQLDFGT